jgi:hypothetical protein
MGEPSDLEHHVEELTALLAKFEARIEAVLALHDPEFCVVCQSAFGCRTRRAAEGDL